MTYRITSSHAGVNFTCNNAIVASFARTELGFLSLAITAHTAIGPADIIINLTPDDEKKLAKTLSRNRYLWRTGKLREALAAMNATTVHGPN